MKTLCARLVMLWDRFSLVMLYLFRFRRWAIEWFWRSSVFIKPEPSVLDTTDILRTLQEKDDESAEWWGWWCWLVIKHRITPLCKCDEQLYHSLYCLTYSTVYNLTFALFVLERNNYYSGSADRYHTKRVHKPDFARYAFMTTQNASVSWLLYVSIFQLLHCVHQCFPHFP